MTFPEDLSPEAKHLLRAARGGDRAQRSEVLESVQRFRQSRVEHRQSRRHRFFGSRHTRRATPWAVVAALCSATLGAYATVGQSLGLPVPGWWPEFTAWSPVDTATAPQLPNRVAHGKDKSEAQAAASDAVGHTAKSTPIDESVGLPGDPAITQPPAARPEPTATPSPGAEAHAANNSLPSLPTSSRTSAQGAITRPTPSATETNPERAPDAVPPETPSIATSGPLAREVQLITAARDALNAGNYSDAERQLDAHRLEFPTGSLSEERQALSAICQCRTGGGANAAQVYVSRRTETPLTRRVARECGLNTQR